MLYISGDRGHTSFVLDLNENAFNASPLSMILVFKLRYKIFHHVKEVSLNFYIIFMNFKNDCWNLSTAVLRFIICSQFFLFSLCLSWVIVGRGVHFTWTLIIDFDHVACFWQWNLIKSGSESVLSPKYHISPHPSCVSASAIRKMGPGSCWSQTERHTEQPCIYPIAWSTTTPANPQTVEWEKEKYLRSSATEILGVFVTHYFHRNSWLKQNLYI